MAEEICFTQKGNVLDEIMNYAVVLPLEGQDQILMIAKAMQYTRKCVKEEILGKV